MEEDIFEAETPMQEAETPEVETTVEETTEVETPEIVTEEPVTAIAVEEVDSTKWVPVTAMTAERNKAKEARDEAERLRQELARYTTSQSQVAQVQAENSIPDPYDDPQGWMTYQQQQIAIQVQQQVFAHNLQSSKARALKEHGEAYINEVADWAGHEADRDPNFEVLLMQQSDPAAWVIEQKKRSDLLKSFEADPDAYVRSRAAELGLAEIPTQVEIPALQPSQVRKPVPSLATAKSTTAHNTAKDALDDLFS